MIPILFDSDEMLFNNNGLGRLRDCISCKVTEGRNDEYLCDFEYPVTGQNYDRIQMGRIIGVTHEDSEDVQPFDIVGHSKPIDGIVTFHANHVNYRQSKFTARGTNIQSLASALTLLRAGSFPAYETPFTYWTDITSSAYFPMADGIPHSVKSMLGGSEGSILDTYGGEYEFDKFNVKLWAQRGQIRDFSIRYGVNMLEFNDEADCSECYNAVIPYWASGSEQVIGTMVTVGSTVTGRTECVPLDITDRFENKPSQAEVETEAANVLNETKPYNPVQTINVKFVNLSDYGYQEFENLLYCKLCDTINVIFPMYGLTNQYKIVKTVWDVLENRYEEMELGSLSTTLSEALGL